PEPEPEPRSADEIEFLEAHGDTLSLFLPRRGLKEVVLGVRSLIPGGYRRLLVDVSGLSHLSGDALEALSRIRTACAEKGLESGLFGVGKEARFVIKVMADVPLPPVLAAQDLPAALAEVGPAGSPG
ncbi:MAG TPA: hypothetical protein DEA08_02425, partial [Planctomycetes bacterium]|nr:hypothetical protein [Planctomycetota bacterium]